MLGWNLMRVAGRSMAPLLEDGDYILCRRYRRRHPPRPGDIAVIGHPRQGLLVKRLRRVPGQTTWWAEGISPASADRAGLGPLAPETIQARACLCIGRRRVVRLTAEAGS